MAQPAPRRGFIYPPLPKEGDFIRLLTIHSGAEGSPIECTLHSASLDETPQYEALSYTWRYDGPPGTILLNQVETQINNNLWQMLLHVRFRDRDRTVWVDALSIRQDDLDEKSEQVRIIHNIFLQASQVIVWLGVAADDSDFLLAELKRSAAEGEAYSAGEHADRLGNAHQALLARPYWFRTWIVQEIYLAKQLRIKCGHAALSGNEFFRGHTNARGPRPLGYSGGHQGKIIEYVRERDGGGRFMRTIFHCLERHEESQCLDIRDKIFALQNMLRRSVVPGRIETPPIVEADYKLSTCVLFFKVLKTWEHIMTLPNVLIVRNALQISQKQLHEVLHSSEQQSIGFADLWISLQTRYHITQVWHSGKDRGWCVFQIVSSGSEMLFVTSRPVKPMQQITRLEGPSSDVAAILDERIDETGWSVWGAITDLKVGYMRPMKLDESKLTIMNDNFFKDTLVVPSSDHNQPFRMRLTLGQVAKLSTPAVNVPQSARSESEGDDGFSPRSVSLSWGKIHHEQSQESNDRVLIPILQFDDGVIERLTVSEVAPDSFLDEINKHKRIMLNRGLAKHGLRPRLVPK